MASHIARMHEFHFTHRSEAPVSTARRSSVEIESENEAPSGRWMTLGIVIAVAVAGLGASTFGYLQAPALSSEPASAPITSRWQPDEELSRATATQALARLEPSVTALEPAPVVNVPLEPTASAEPTAADSDNPY